MDLRQLASALSAFAVHSPTHWPNHFSQLFLAVAEHQPATFRELGDVLGLSNSAISRTVAALGDTNRKGADGFGLVAVAPDPYEGRRLIVTLTPKGEALKRQLLLL
jgi:DNA-binding MarR family transcriptional regulator